MRAQIRTLVFPALLLAIPSVALAIDGQVDIATTPYTISEPGSYVVVADLNLGEPDQNGIEIVVGDVTLDLNGHSVAGPGSANGSSGSGIHVVQGANNVAIRNGTLRAWRGDGIQAAGAVGCRMEDLTVRNNGGWGIDAGRASRIERCVCLGNGGGIQGGEASLIINNQCHDNLTSSGIKALWESEVSQNICRDNSLNGIDSGRGARVVANVCAANGADGIANQARSTVEGNEVLRNGQVGIRSGGGSFINKNMLAGNKSDGIQVTGSCKVTGSRITTWGSDVLPDSAAIRASGVNNEIRDNLLINYSRGLVLDSAPNVVADNLQYGTGKNIEAAPGNLLEIVITELPFTIMHPGVYRLAGDVRLNEADQNGILIASYNVTLDLGGHVLTGPGRDVGTLGSGIALAEGDYFDIVVRNGAISNWRGAGIDAARAQNSRFENLQCWGNGENGVVVGVGCTVRDNLVKHNGGAGGIIVGDGSTVTGNVCQSNDGGGIFAPRSTTVENTVSSNGGVGIYASFGARVTGNTISDNGGPGIVADSDCTVAYNTVSHNALHGIEVRGACVIVDNYCAGNGFDDNVGAGVYANDPGSNIERNVAINNDNGIQCIVGGNYIAANRATGNGADYVLAGGNTEGSGDLANVSY